MVNRRIDDFGKVMTVLRGDALRDARVAGTAPAQSVIAGPMSRGECLPQGESAEKNATTIYGVPVSAVQHCCGRGCKHCQIYWHRLKP
jgi:hypothetical protein